MITEHDLQEAIAECEGQRNPNANTCLKLAAFYTIKDKMYPEAVKAGEPVFYSRASRNDNAYNSDSEFGQIIGGLSAAEYMPIIDELMSTLAVLHPRLYAAVIRKLTAQKEK